MTRQRWTMLSLVVFAMLAPGIAGAADCVSAGDGYSMTLESNDEVTSGAELCVGGRADIQGYATVGQLVFDADTPSTIVPCTSADQTHLLYDPTGNTLDYCLNGASAGQVVGTTATQTLTNKTLTTPTIGSFTNATHTHTNAAGGGAISVPTVLYAAPAIPSTSATNWWWDGSATAFETSEQIILPMATTGTVKRLYCKSDRDINNGGGTQTYAMTLRKNAGACGSGLTCTITEGATLTCNDTSNSCTVTAGDAITLQSVPANTPVAAIITCSIVLEIPL